MTWVKVKHTTMYGTYDVLGNGVELTIRPQQIWTFVKEENGIVWLERKSVRIRIDKERYQRDFVKKM